MQKATPATVQPGRVPRPCRVPRPRLITFDFGDTLVTSEPPYLSRIAMGLAELGYPRDTAEVEAAFHRADLSVVAGLIGRSFEPMEYIRGLGQELFKILNLNGDEKLFRELSEWLLSFKPKRVLLQGARELLDSLQDQGYLLGIISNNDGSTREKCASVDIERYLKFILDSTLEGMMKPDRRFFQLALDRAGVRADQALHVGDLWGSDVIGSRAAGLWSIWLKNDYLSPAAMERTFRVLSLSEIPGLIEE